MNELQMSLWVHIITIDFRQKLLFERAKKTSKMAAADWSSLDRSK
jgi:hypothetical protein